MMHPTDPNPADKGWRNFYGRLKGKTLRPEQIRRLQEDLPRLSVARVTRDENPAREPLDVQAISGGQPLWLEVGFGSGEHMIHQAKSNPGVMIIGCEPYINGVAVALGKIAREATPNVRIHPGDARDLLDVLPECSLDKAFLLYPDPWPKARHHRRRFVTAEHLLPLYRAMKPGAELRIATDIADYVRQAMEEVPDAGFVWMGRAVDDWDTPWEDWISTRYEQKALREGRPPHYLTFRRP